METKKLYYDDVYCRAFTARVTGCVQEKKTWLVTLDQTAFYPEGGGQPADHGTLTLPDGARLTVTDVHEQGGVIWHRVDALPDTAAPGTAVTGRIDWAWRFDKMQQHTGEHILSGILHQMFGAENVGFHIGSDAVRMDTSVPVSAEGLREAELAANRIVWQNVPVLITYPTREELARMTYRSKKEIEGQVRIVTIPGADVCACCGTHTAATGAVGQIKILAAENYKGGVRLSIVCGERALLAAQAMRQRQADIGALLSAKPSETAHAVHRVYDEYTALKFAHFGLCSELFDALAAQVALTAFIPMLMDTGGNSGSQACVSIIRGISLNEIEFRDLGRVVWKEIRVSVLCGVCLAIACFAKIIVVDMLLLKSESVTYLVAFVVCATMAVTVCLAKIVGSTLPLLAKKIGFDPAVMASPFITTIVDALSLLIYFRFASFLLGI